MFQPTPQSHNKKKKVLTRERKHGNCVKGHISEPEVRGIEVYSVHRTLSPIDCSHLYTLFSMEAAVLHRKSHAVIRVRPKYGDLRWRKHRCCRGKRAILFFCVTQKYTNLL